MNVLYAKFSSGRWIATVAASYLLVHGTLVGIFDAKDVMVIVTAILISYFQRADRKNPDS